VLEPTTIAALLRELAVYYELDGDKHRAFAYERASKSIEAANGLHRLIDEGRLEELPGVGPSIARVVADLARTGTVPILERQRAQWPAVVIELAQLPKVGVPKARRIFQSLAPADLDSVAEMCRAGLIRELPGLGKISEQKILQAIEDRRRHGARQILIDAEDQATSIAHHLRADPAAQLVEICGPVRRWCEVVDRLAFAVASDSRDAIADRLAGYALVTSVDRASRDTTSPATSPEEPLVGFLVGGMRAEVHVAPRARLGWAQIVATGSPAHVAALRARAAERGIDLSRLEAADEEHVYTALGLPLIPPELRDGTDEIAAALAGDRFTDLITLDDLTTVFHCHTVYSDGKQTIAQMAQAAAELGYAGITITDHSAAAGYANGLDLVRLREQAAEISGLHSEARILRGTEADILADGSIDVPREMVRELDLIIASVHQRYGQGEDDTTARLVAAMRQPFFKIWGHALGRLVLRRDPIAVRLDEVLDAVAESPAAIEINGDPYRLDLDPENARRAAARGIKFVLSCDAHSTKALEMTRYAVAMARRARIRKSAVLNALPVDELAQAIRPASRAA
jgi:DNA polymerase (family X)